MFSKALLTYRHFGYEQPDTNSRKLMLISSFQDEVDGNPFHFPLGAYHQFEQMAEIKLKFISATPSFIKMKIIKGTDPQKTVYFKHKQIDVSKDL